MMNVECSAGRCLSDGAEYRRLGALSTYENLPRLTKKVYNCGKNSSHFLNKRCISDGIKFPSYSQRCKRSRIVALQGGDGILHAPGLNTDSPRRNSGHDAWHVLGNALKRILPEWLPLELVKRISVSLGMLCLARVGHYIRLPGLQSKELSGEMMPKSLTATMTGTASEIDGNIYLLSITPYMTAGLTLAALQLIPEVRRHLDSLRDEGRSGRETINHYTSILFILAALIQAFSNASQLSSIAANGGKLFQIQTALTLMAGAVLCKYAVQNIDHFGVGDGTGVIIGAGIALSYSEYICQLWAHIQAMPMPPLVNILGACAICMATIVLVTWVQGIELRLPLAFFSARRSQASSAGHSVVQKLNKGNRYTSETSLDMQSLFPLRLSPSGTRQLLFANFWASLLQAPLQAIGCPGLLQNPFAFALVVFLFEAFSFSDATPKQMSIFLSQNDAGIRGLSPGDATREFLQSCRARLKFLNAGFIAGISLLSRVIDIVCVLLIGVAPNMLSLLLLVSTILGGSRQAEALIAGNKVQSILSREAQRLDNIARTGYA